MKLNESLLEANSSCAFDFGLAAGLIQRCAEKHRWDTGKTFKFLPEFPEQVALIQLTDTFPFLSITLLISTRSVDQETKARMGKVSIIRALCFI